MEIVMVDEMYAILVKFIESDQLFLRVSLTLFIKFLKLWLHSGFSHK